jgi:hypothetical protein
MKKKTIDLDQIKKDYFKLYPKSKVLYFTTDGNCFLQKSPAIDHARKSKCEWVSEDNPALLKEIKEDAKKAQEAQKAAELAAAKEALKSWNPEQSEYKIDYSLACDLDLELKDKTHETVIAALKEAQAKLNENK